MAHLFKGTGLIFLEPSLLRGLSENFFRKEIEESQAILKILQNTKKKLIEKGGEAPLPVEKGPQLFLKSSTKKREKIIFEENLFKIGKEHLPKEELLKILKEAPERFSSNAASRPILQSAILPTAAYVAGPTEFKYFHQLKEYHIFHDVPMPWIVKRLSATFITPEGADMLKKLELNPWQTIPTHWNELFPDLKEDLDIWEKSSEEIASLQLMPLLKNYLWHQRRGMEKMILEKRLKEKKIPKFALHYLRNLLHPHDNHQERILNFCAFQKETKDNLIIKLLNTLRWNLEGHIYISID